MNLTPYIGEIRMFAGDNPPEGWKICNGDELQINDYHLLYGKIYETFGGDGHSTFCVPDLRGRLPVNLGRGEDTVSLFLGQKVGGETTQITANNFPKHTHVMYGSADIADSTSPTGNFLATTRISGYAAFKDGSNVVMKIGSIGDTGGDAVTVPTIQAYQTINFMIAYEGI